MPFIASFIFTCDAHPNFEVYYHPLPKYKHILLKAPSQSLSSQKVIYSAVCAASPQNALDVGILFQF